MIDFQSFSLLAAIECAVGVGVFLLGLYFFIVQIQSRRWPPTKGFITDSHTEKVRTKYGYEFVPEIEYRYVVNHETFKSDRRRFGNFSLGDRMSATEVLAKYPEGKEVIVFVNPRNPQKAVLEPGVSFTSFATMLLGIVIAFLALL